MDFKIGDSVKVIDGRHDEKHLVGMIGKIVKLPDNDYVTYHVDFGTRIIHDNNNGVNETTHIFYDYELELSKKQTKPDDMIRYIAYGTGCNNLGKIKLTDKELKEDLKEHTRDSSWTGEIIGYKMVPIYKAELITRLNVFKVPTIKKLKKK